MSSHRSLTAVLTGLLVLTLLATPAASQPAPTDQPRPAPDTLIAPNAPDALSLSCAEGQFDLNTPDADAFAGLTKADGDPLSEPIRSRIVAGQPYLRATDLRTPAVAGITPADISAWIAAGEVCITPPMVDVDTPDGPSSVPDYLADVCPADGARVDVNDPASHDALARMFGRPTADRLTASLPYPTVDNAVRVAGVGPGKVRKHADDLCATPWPITFDGTDWAWAGPDGIVVTTTGELGDYALTVPAGTTDGDGSWASITEVDSPFDEFAGVGDNDLPLPAADPHIHGAFDGFVAVSQPQDPSNVPAAWPHGVLHWADDGLELYGGEAVHESDGTVTVATDDLSIFSAIRAASDWLPSGVVGAVGWFVNLTRSFIGSGGQVNCSPDLGGNPDLGGGERFDVNGDLLEPLPFTPPLNHCVTPDGDRPDARFGNGRGIVQRINGRDGVTVHDVGTSGNILWQIITGKINDSNLASGGPLYLAPGATFAAHTTGYRGTITMETRPASFFVPTTMYVVSEELGTLIPVPLFEFIFDFENCAVGVITQIGDVANGEVEALNGIIESLTGAAQCAAARIDSLPPGDVRDTAEAWLTPDYRRAFQFGGSIDRFIKIVKLGKIALAIANATAMSGANGTIEIAWRPQTPPYPATDDQGRALYIECASRTFDYDTGWTISIDQDCQDAAYGTVDPGPEPPVGGPPVNAFADFVGAIDQLRMYNLLRRDAAGVLHLILLEDGELVAHPIAQSEEWAFKQDWPEDEWRSAEFDGLVDRVGDPAVNDPLRLRNYLQGRGHTWLLRLEDGTAYRIDAEGLRSPLGTVEAQQAWSNQALTFHPAQYASDVCPYPTRAERDSGRLRVC